MKRFAVKNFRVPGLSEEKRQRIEKAVKDHFNKTYDEWKAKGFQVQKGQKAAGRNAKGEATFRSNQVDYIPDEDWDEDDHQQFMDTYGYGRDWI